MKFIGHSKQWRFIKALVRNSRRPHAFLFSGAEQLGKKKVALELIKSLDCQTSNDGCCGACATCRSFKQRTHPDFIFLEPQEGKREIQIAQAREMIWKLSLKPLVSFFKTAIIDNAHLLNRESQNALLKTLEEPKGETLLILISHRPQFLLPTVRSRLQEIKFFPVVRPELEKFLSEKGVLQKEIDEIIELAGGRPGRALGLWQEPQQLARQKETRKALPKLLKSDLAGRFSYAKDKSLEEIKENLEIWLGYLREILLLGLRTRSRDLSEILRAIQAIERLNLVILTHKNINPRLALEGLMLELSI